MGIKNNYIKKEAIIGLIFSLFLLCVIAQSCSKGKCHLAILSFNNQLSEKITVLVYGLGEKDIEAEGSETFKLKPHVLYQYDVMSYETHSILVQSEESVASCESKEINIE